MRMLRIMMVATASFVAVAFGVKDVEDVEVHMMSFNIRTSQASVDKGAKCSHWDGIRKDNVLKNIKTVAADFVGTQETSDAQKGFLDGELAGTYSVIGESTGSLNGNAAEWNAIYYLSDTWKPITNGMFWLGPDPNTMSAAWGMAYYRTCVWGRFQHIDTGATVCVLNTHYETPGNDEAQENGSNIILERIKTNCNADDNLVVLMGDFNALRSYPAMQILFENGMEDPSDEGTFCGDMGSPTCSVKFDFTLFRAQSEDACYLKSEISRINYDGCYTSDHAGLVGSFCLQGSCCSNSSSSDLDMSNLQKDGFVDQNEIVGKVQAPDTEVSKKAKADKDVTQISTSSESDGNATIKIGGILAALCVCAVLAAVVVRQKKKLSDQTNLEKLDPNINGEAWATSNESGLSPLAETDDDRASNSPIPELAAISCSLRVSTSSSISAPDSEVVRHGDRISELSKISSNSSIPVMNAARSDYSSSMGNSVVTTEDDNESIISYGKSSVSSCSYAESYVNSSIATSTVSFSGPDSCVSDDKHLEADFTKL